MGQAQSYSPQGTPQSMPSSPFDPYPSPSSNTVSNSDGRNSFSHMSSFTPTYPSTSNVPQQQSSFMSMAPPLTHAEKSAFVKPIRPSPIKDMSFHQNLSSSDGDLVVKVLASACDPSLLLFPIFYPICSCALSRLTPKPMEMSPLPFPSVPLPSTLCVQCASSVDLARISPSSSSPIRMRPRSSSNLISPWPSTRPCQACPSMSRSLWALCSPPLPHLTLRSPV